MSEIRGGMLHSQLIGEQMKGAQELKADTAQKMKPIELTEEERQEREELRYEIWEAKIGRHKRATGTMEEMGWGKKKLNGRVEKREEKRTAEKTRNNKETSTIKKRGSRKSCSNRDVHQKRAGGKKEKNKGETYIIKDCTILDVS